MIWYDAKLISICILEHSSPQELIASCCKVSSGWQTGIARDPLPLQLGTFSDRTAAKRAVQEYFAGSVSPVFERMSA